MHPGECSFHLKYIFSHASDSFGVVLPQQLFHYRLALQIFTP